MSATIEGGFEVLRFAGQPANPETALVELEGRFPAGPPRRPARLVVEGPADEPVECSAAVQSSPGDGTWRATFAVPLELFESGGYALAADGVLVDLPRPDVEAVDGDADRLVRFARDANDLRRRLDAARAGRAEAEERAERLAAELEVEHAERAAAERARDAEAATVAELRAELEAERERLSTTEAGLREELQADRERSDAELESLREQLAAARADADARESAAVAERDRLLDAERLERETLLGREQDRAARELEEAVAAERARAHQLSHELRAARAENEAIRREPAPPRRVTQNDAEPEGGGPEAHEEATLPIAKRRALNRDATPTPADEPTTAIEPPGGDGGGEGVRLLSARPRRPRHSAEDEPGDVAPAPGAAAAGARQIEPVPGSEELPIARILAVGALALAVVIVLLLLLKL